ncbi:unnamed protein product [Bursaphelenchus xylophilus]|uniref:polyribonucleotide nucleotidyltransferase n=1 Tax=Bursaphelenchus xylophilus TaxID=6326 RepID=A0A1I7SLI8_BURXY|nr:unnamed protein product [Bursaphelenchus xylophilus]CAG9129627.1 unnamed protein product [Bursaphelenchus xylophilus]
MLRWRLPISVRRYSSAMEGWINQQNSELAQLSNGQMEFKTGHLARFASGACTVTLGDSTVLATTVCKPDTSGTSPFSSGKALSVDFLQSASAVGRIPMNYLRRELQQTDMDILISRMIDRSLRPLYSSSFRGNTKIICKPLSAARDADMAVLGINAASCSIALSECPFAETVGAARIALLDNEIVLNPPHYDLQQSRMNLLLSGTKSKKVLMIEMDGKEIPMDTFMESIEVGFSDIEKVIDAIDALKSSSGKDKIPEDQFMTDVEKTLLKDIFDMACDRLEYILTDATHLKTSRDEAITAYKKELIERILTKNSGTLPATVSLIFDIVVKNILRRLTRESGIRVDGRAIDEFRPISIQTDLYPRLHGSAMFQRGQSQVMGTVTFDSPQSAFRPDAIAQLLGAQQKKSFMVHYEFPQFAVNQISDSSGRFNRRSLGHGTLAEKALKNVVPEDFPYCIRVDCQVLESNGSTSMASACVGSLAMYDAGVPLKNAVGGVAIGLFNDNGELLATENDKPVILTDLMGMEDYAGDMDFKIAGTKDGFTSIQLDVSIPGLTMDLVRESLERGRHGLDHVLAKMNEALPKPRTQFKECVPLLEHVILPGYKRSALFRNAGFNAKLVEAETGVQVQADEEDKILLMAPTKEDAARAKELINKLTDVSTQVDPNFGEIQKCEVIEVLDRGIVVKLKAFKDPVFVPIKSLTPKLVKHTSALDVKIGQKLSMQFFGRNPETGQPRLATRSIGTKPVDLK